MSIPLSGSSSVFVVRYRFDLSKAEIHASDNTAGYLSLSFFPIVIVFPLASFTVVASLNGAAMIENFLINFRK